MRTNDRWLCLGIFAMLMAPALRAQTVAEQYLFAAANAERSQRGLPELRWNAELYRAAQAHAAQMAAHGSISHQFPGEPALLERASTAGARFTVVAENVAVAGTGVEIHELWMHSPEHRANLLDARLNSVAIAVVRNGTSLYAVQDFDRRIQPLSLLQQETTVGQALHAQSAVAVDPANDDARRTCAQETGYVGSPRPWFVMRYTAGSLDQLPEELVNRLNSGKYRRAVVAACPATDTQGFSAYRIAVLLYPQ